jgi:hypothetical protein
VRLLHGQGGPERFLASQKLEAFEIEISPWRNANTDQTSVCF